MLQRSTGSIVFQVMGAAIASISISNLIVNHMDINTGAFLSIMIEKYIFLSEPIGLAVNMLISFLIDTLFSWEIPEIPTDLIIIYIILSGACWRMYAKLPGAGALEFLKALLWPVYLLDGIIKRAASDDDYYRSSIEDNIRDWIFEVFVILVVSGVYFAIDASNILGQSL